MSYLIIVNPHAGNKDNKKVIQQLTEMLHAHHFSYVLKYTTKTRDAEEFAKEAREKTIIVAGGDGTVNEVVNGIMQNSLKPRLAILPIGTSNMLARALKIPSNVKKAIAIIAENRRKDFDLGFLHGNQKYFAIGCGVGLDAVAYKNVEPKIKKFFGEIAYPISFLQTLFNYEPKELIVKNEGKEYKAYYVLVLNTAKFTNFLELAKKSSNHDGYLDVLLFSKKDIISQFKYLVGLITKQHTRFNDIVSLKVKKIEIECDEKVLVHTDAEIAGTTPIIIEVKQHAIEVVC